MSGSRHRFTVVTGLAAIMLLAGCASTDPDGGGGIGGTGNEGPCPPGVEARTKDCPDAEKGRTREAKGG